MSKDTIRRGGRRPGAGRKPTEDKRVSVTIRISQDTSMRLRCLRERAITLGRLVDDIVERAYHEMQQYSIGLQYNKSNGSSGQHLLGRYSCIYKSRAYFPAHARPTNNK